MTLLMRSVRNLKRINITGFSLNKQRLFYSSPDHVIYIFTAPTKKKKKKKKKKRPLNFYTLSAHIALDHGYADEIKQNI